MLEPRQAKADGSTSIPAGCLPKSASRARVQGAQEKRFMTTLEVHQTGKSLKDVVRLAQQESEVVLLDGAQPVARVLPIRANDQPMDRVFGLHAGAYEVGEDFDTPLPDEFWAGQP
jgi:antitoxin (DNA-binding transcriptional repressor) of toxin-antitoxin stability system